jgi:cytochrome P450
MLEYHSWNAGPRSCLGRALATYEGLSIAAAIVQRFDVQLTEPDKKFESLPALNMGIKGGLHMRVRKRSPSSMEAVV